MISEKESNPSYFQHPRISNWRQTFLFGMMLIASLLSVNMALAQTWGDIEYKGEPWVKNITQPYKISRGLEGRHLSVWASHGRY